MKTVRKIVKINDDLCNGCGNCTFECKENAVILIKGKATISKESLCDGIGDCLKRCPNGAITIEERLAEPYDEIEASNYHSIYKKNLFDPLSGPPNWPLKIQLVSPLSPILKNADLIIAADCTAFAKPDFHKNYSGNNPVIIGCTKLANNSLYLERLTEMFKVAEIKSCTVVRMELPCCKTLLAIVKQALNNAEKIITINEKVVKTY